jgi:hypothetical protein
LTGFLTLLREGQISAIDAVGSLVRPAAAGRSLAGPAVVSYLGAVLVAASADHGGFFPDSWGWMALALLWLAGIAVLMRPRIALSRLERASVAALVLLAGWTGISAAWSLDASLSLLGAQRALVYAAALAAPLLALRRRAATPLLAAALVAVTCVSTYAVSTRLFPARLGLFNDELANGRLYAPLDYWNALGIYATIGVLLALGFAARARRPSCRALSGLVAPVLACTVYFTFSRGAWAALAVGLVVMVAVDRRRLHLTAAMAVAAAPAAVAVLLAAGSARLTSPTLTLAGVPEGRRLALWIGLCCAASAAATVLFVAAERRTRPRQALRRAWVAALGLAICFALVIAPTARYGSPAAAVRAAYHSLLAPTAPIDPQARLHTLSLNRRLPGWRVAWANYTDHPLFGSGAETYESVYFRMRRDTFHTSEAHSVYLEMLAELGPVGLALLIVALAAPLVAAVRARGPVSTIASGGYVAVLLHAGIDWDWEMPAVVLLMLLVGSALLLNARRGGEAAMQARGRALTLAAVLAGATVAFAGLVGEGALAASTDALNAGNTAKAVAEAERARRWEPWSYRPLAALAEARLRAGDRAGARAAFTEAVRMEPDQWALWFGVARASSGRPAAVALRRALRLNPLSPELAAWHARHREPRRPR